MKFTVGQVVICINAKGLNPPVLTLGARYTIKALGQLCCQDDVDVGFSIPPKFTHHVCDVCGTRVPFTPGSPWWFHARRFAPLEERGEVFIEDILQLQEVPNETQETVAQEVVASAGSSTQGYGLGS